VAACGQAAWVDRQIAELVYWMWRAGVRTTNSCQDFLDDPGDQRIFLAFEHPDDLCLFLSLVAPQDGQPGGLWDRASGCNLTADENGMWDYEAGPDIRGRKVTLQLSAIIPNSDGPELIRRLRQHAPDLHADHGLAAASLGISRRLFTARLSEARQAFLRRWHEGESPSRVWTTGKSTLRWRRRAHRAQRAAQTGQLPPPTPGARPRVDLGIPDAELARRYQAGQTCRQLAAALGTSYNVIRDRLLTQGTQLRPPGQRAQPAAGRPGA
jgi:hypothetical protein